MAPKASCEPATPGASAANVPLRALNKWTVVIACFSRVTSAMARAFLCPAPGLSPEHFRDRQILQCEPGHIEDCDVGGIARERHFSGQKIADFGRPAAGVPLAFADSGRLLAVVGKEPYPAKQAVG